VSYGDETVVFFEIDQPFCRKTYGAMTDAGTCAAVLGTTGPAKCYNTRSTCQDPVNYLPAVQTLRFARPQEGLLQYDAVIPSLVAISTTAGSINLAAMEKSASALGTRESVSVQFSDHRHSDLLVDKYRLERATGAASSPSVPFDPYLQGTFWGKWLARNPYYSFYPCRVREGAVGQALADMRTRSYIIDRVEGPSEGTVRLTAKDLFSIIERTKAVAPKASRGELLADLTGSPGTFTLAPADIGALDYPTAGYVNIGDEIIQFTRSGDVMTVVARGALNTVQANHQQEDLVQLVLQYQGQLAHDIIYDLLCAYTALGSPGPPVSSPYIDKAEWDAAAETFTALYTGRVATPTSVQDLIGELCEQAAFSVWPDVGTGMLKLKAFRAANSSATIDDDSYIVEKSLSLKRQPDRRISQVWVYYAQINPVTSLTEKRNYRSRVIPIDGDAESAQQYGTPAIREVFSRWIPQFGRGVAEAAGERILAMFRDPPVEAEFQLHANRAAEVPLAGLVTLETLEVQDATGAADSVQHMVTKIKRDEDRLTLTTQSVGFPFTPTDKVIFVEQSTNDLNLRALHDSIYTAPVGGLPTENITFIIESGVVVGSTSASTAALTVGSWPSGVHLVLTNNGEVQGKGGAGNIGGSADLDTCPSKGVPIHYTLTAGSAGLTGGPAIDATGFAIFITNNGAVRGGGGGAGGGGAAAGGNQTWQPGGGGGGGRGSTVSAGGTVGNRTNSAGCSVSPYPQNLDALAAVGSDGNATGPGAGGDGGLDEQSGIYTFGGDAGTGGDWGTAGAAGGAGSGGIASSSGGAGGGAGPAAIGSSNVTWVVSGTIQGPLS
jgi:hypothetical protein